jgi:hypothetical protein
VSSEELAGIENLLSMDNAKLERGLSVLKQTHKNIQSENDLVVDNLNSRGFELHDSEHLNTLRLKLGAAIQGEFHEDATKKSLKDNLKTLKAISLSSMKSIPPGHEESD